MIKKRIHINNCHVNLGWMQYKSLIVQSPKSKMCVSDMSEKPFLLFFLISLLARHRLTSKARLQIRGSNNYRCLYYSFTTRDSVVKGRDKWV